MFVGIDQSLTSTALVTLSESGDAPIAKHRITPDPLRESQRVQFVRDAVSQFVAEAKPRAIAMEGYGFGARKSRAHALGELGGAIKLALYEMGHTIAIVPPSTLKKFVTGKGNADKSAMMVEILDRWHFKTSNDDIADAYGLAQFIREITLKRKSPYREKVEFIRPIVE